MRLTKDYIINHIRETKYPCWSLFVMQNYKRVPIMHYNGDDFTPDDDGAAKAEKAINRLDGALQSIPRDALLCIELRSSKGANGSQGTIGPFEFYNYNKDEAAEPQQPQQNFSGFGFVQPPAGWVSEATLNGRLEEIKVESEKRINDILFKQREKDFEERKQREYRELAELRKELNDEKRKYESNTGAAAETLVFAIKKILVELFPNLPFAQQQPAALAGTTGEETKIEDVKHVNVTSPKYKAIERFANMLYENNNITVADVEKLNETIINNKVQEGGENV